MTRLRILIIIIITLMFALPAVDSKNFANEAQAQVVVVQGNGVRLRVGPGLGYDVYKQVNRGTRLSYNYTSGDWYCINYNGYKLFIHRDFASLSYNSGNSTNRGNNYNANTYNYVRVTGNGVRLRTGPGLGYDVYKQVNRGTKLRYVSTQGDWYCVLYNNYYLYVSRDFATLSR